MRVLVAGSVSWADGAAIEAALDTYARAHDSMILITGMANGADEIARCWALRNGVRVLAEPLTGGAYPEPMHRYNQRMLNWQPDVVLAFKADFDLVNNANAGTEHMCALAESSGIKVRLFT